MKEIFDLIIFDLDGTLTDSGEGITKSVQYTLEKYGIHEPDLEKLRKFIGPPLIDSFMKYYGFTKEGALEAREVFNERYIPIGWRENHLYPGIEEVLKNLKEKGKLLAIATSKPENTAHRVLTYFGLMPYFDIFCAAPQNGLNAEKDGRIRAVLEKARTLGCPAATPVMVGDTHFDVEGAHKCQVPCIGVTWGYAVAGEFENCGADYVVNTMEELRNLLT